MIGWSLLAIFLGYSVIVLASYAERLVDFDFGDGE